MAYIVKACVILCHVAIEDERDPDGIIFESFVQDSITSSSTVFTAPNLSIYRAFTSFIDRYKAIRSSEMHCQLRNDLSNIFGLEVVIRMRTKVMTWLIRIYS